jgi:hypothetical protein
VEQGSILPSRYDLTGDKDLALLRVRLAKFPDLSTAALPGIASKQDFIARFIGANKPISVDAALVAAYPEAITMKEIALAAQQLNPDRLSIAVGKASFISILRKGGQYLREQGPNSTHIPSCVAVLGRHHPIIQSQFKTQSESI